MALSALNTVAQTLSYSSSMAFSCARSTGSAIVNKTTSIALGIMKNFAYFAKVTTSPTLGAMAAFSAMDAYTLMNNPKSLWFSANACQKPDFSWIGKIVVTLDPALCSAENFLAHKELYLMPYLAVGFSVAAFVSYSIFDRIEKNCG